METHKAFAWICKILLDSIELDHCPVIFHLLQSHTHYSCASVYMRTVNFRGHKDAFISLFLISSFHRWPKRFWRRKKNTITICLQPSEKDTLNYSLPLFSWTFHMFGRGQNKAEWCEQSRDVATAVVAHLVLDWAPFVTPQRADFQAFCKVGEAREVKHFLTSWQLVVAVTSGCSQGSENSFSSTSHFSEH